MANPKNTSTRLKYCKSHSTAPDVKRRKKGGKEEGKEGRKEGRREGGKAGRKTGRQEGRQEGRKYVHFQLGQGFCNAQ